MTTEGKKVNPLLIVIIVLGLLVVALGVSTTILLLKGNNKCKDAPNSGGDKPTEISGDITVLLAKKIDDSKTYVVDGENKEGNYKVNSYPAINIDTSSVKMVNQEFERSYQEKINTYENYAYFYIIYNKYLSVVSYYTDRDIPIIDKAFVIDLTTGLRFEGHDLLEVFGYTDEELPDKAIEAGFNAFDEDLNKLIEQYPKMYEEDRDYMLLNTSESLNKRFYFIDATGRLYQIYTCASYNKMGLTGNFKTIDLSNYSLAIYKLEEK